MAQEAKVAINIASEFTGKKAFKQADTAVSNLAKNLKRAVIGASFAAFAKSAVSAFIVADKTAQSFANTMKNIGLSEATADVMAMTDAMEMQFGVAASRLIPAYQKFAVITRSTADSQNLLNLALDVSAGTSASLETVTTAFTRALNGNNTSLGKLGSNLTKTDLATGSLNDNLKKLADNYSGAASTASETLSNKITRVGLAFQKAKEKIGGGIIDALVAVTGSANIEQLQQSILAFGKSAAEVLVKVGNLIGKNIEFIKQLGIVLFAVWTSSKIYAGVSTFLKLGEGILTFYRTLRNVSIAAAIAEMTAINPIAGVVGGVALVAGIIAANKALDSFENSVKSTNKLKLTLPKFGGIGTTAQELANQKKLTDQKNKQLKADKEAAALKKASAVLDLSSKVFDMDLIQNTAALQGKLTEDETRRLKLQQAILMENSTEAGKLAQELIAAQIEAMKLSQTDPLKGWSDSFKSAIKALLDLQRELGNLDVATKLLSGVSAAGTVYSGGTMLSSGAILAKDQQGYGVLIPAPGAPQIDPSLFGSDLSQSTSTTSQYTAATGNFTYGQGNPLAVQVFIDPLAAAAGVSAASINNNANGNSNGYSTIQSFAGGR